MELVQSDAFRDWLRGLRDRAAKARILARLGRMAEGHVGDCKALGGGLFEARVHCGPGYRLYFLREGDALIVLLCGGDKSSQRRDIARARELANDWR